MMEIENVLNVMLDVQLVVNRLINVHLVKLIHIDQRNQIMIINVNVYKVILKRIVKSAINVIILVKIVKLLVIIVLNVSKNTH